MRERGRPKSYGERLAGLRAEVGRDEICWCQSNARGTISESRDGRGRRAQQWADVAGALYHVTLARFTHDSHASCAAARGFAQYQAQAHRAASLSATLLDVISRYAMSPLPRTQLQVVLFPRRL